MNNRNVVMYPDDGSGGAGGTGGAGGAGGGGQQPFPSPADARTFLADYVHDGEFLKSVPDEKVVPWASKIKGRVDELGSQFPGNWRNQIAGENQDHLKTLERFASPKNLYESYSSLRSKVSSGELRAVMPFPAQGTPEQQLEWRKTNGVPDTVEGYKFALPEKFEPTDDDKAVMASMAKSAHASNMRPEHAQALFGWYLGERQQREEARAQKDSDFHSVAEDALRAEWQTDYRGNVARIGALLDSAPQGIKNKVAGARMQDGSLLGDDPDFARWLVDVSRQVNPAGVVLPGTGGNLTQSIDDEIASIEKLMREDRPAYNKDEKKQARYRDLLDARSKYQQQNKKVA